MSEQNGVAKFTEFVRQFSPQRGGGDGFPRVYYLKEGETVLRLVPERGNPDPVGSLIQTINVPNRFAPVDENGKRRMIRQFLVRAIVVAPQQEGIAPYTVQPVRLPKTVLDLLAPYLDDPEYDLVSETGGAPVKIVRVGSGRDTVYQVKVSPRPLDIRGKIIDLPAPFSEIAAQVEAREHQFAERRAGAAGPKEEIPLAW